MSRRRSKRLSYREHGFEVTVSEKKGSPIGLEDSVYIDEGMNRRGIGRALLFAVISRCESAHWRQMIAVIGDSGNVASIGLMKVSGFGSLELFDPSA